MACVKPPLMPSDLGTNASEEVIKNVAKMMEMMKKRI